MKIKCLLSSSDAVVRLLALFSYFSSNKATLISRYHVLNVDVSILIEVNECVKDVRIDYITSPPVFSSNSSVF